VLRVVVLWGFPSCLVWWIVTYTLSHTEIRIHTCNAYSLHLCDWEMKDEGPREIREQHNLTKLRFGLKFSQNPRFKFSPFRTRSILGKKGIERDRERERQSPEVVFWLIGVNASITENQ
jgi:hypothetical protein